MIPSSIQTRDDFYTWKRPGEALTTAYTQLPIKRLISV